MNHSTPGLPIHHQLPEFTQTHVHWVGDAIQPSHPLPSPFPPALNLSQHQGLFKMSQFFTSGGLKIGVSASTSVLPMNTQDWSPLVYTGWISLQSKGLLNCFNYYLHCCAVLSHLSHVWLFATPWTIAHKSPLSMGFSRQEYWSGLLFRSPGDLSHPGIKPKSPVLQADFFY